MARRTKQDVEELSNILYDIVNQLRPMTIRSLFYRAVSMGAVDKTEKEYKAITWHFQFYSFWGSGHRDSQQCSQPL